MELLDRIESQVAATRLPLFAVTLAAVPCADTPVILALHWHGFIREKLCDAPGAGTVAFTPVPSSALQVNERWRDLETVEGAVMEAAWELGAWDVQRVERRACMRPGAESREHLECLQAFGTFPFGPAERQAVVMDAPDVDELIEVAARRGYLMWLFRPVSGGIWGEYADDATLDDHGRRHAPCPLKPVAPTCEASRQAVYRFGIAANRALADNH